ncbi:hypothetical protein BpHYR1_006800, partial [Brachionus plicatilis]
MLAISLADYNQQFEDLLRTVDFRIHKVIIYKQDNLIEQKLFFLEIKKQLNLTYTDEYFLCLKDRFNISDVLYNSLSKFFIPEVPSLHRLKKRRDEINKS